MKKNESYSLIMNQKKHLFPRYAQCKDSYLYQLGELLEDLDLDWLLEELEDFDSRGYGGNKMEMDFIGSKVIIRHQYGENTEYKAIEIDRTALIELVRTYIYLLENKSEEITLFRDDQQIAIVGKFGDKPEFEKIVAYRCRGNAFNQAKIVLSQETYERISLQGDDNFLRKLTSFFLDYITDLDTIITSLEDPDIKEISHSHMHAFCNKSKVTIIDTRDEYPYDEEIDIDRTYLINLVKAWQKLVVQKPYTIFIQRNDDYITCIGKFGNDLSEYKEKIAYRPGNWIME